MPAVSALFSLSDGKPKLHIHRRLCKISSALALADRFNSEGSFANEASCSFAGNRRT